MGYNYQEHRALVFSEEGQRMFLSIRDKANRLLKDAGAARMQEIISGQCGDSWAMLACVDRLVELGELRELTALTPGYTPGQYRVFVKAKD